MTVEEFCEKYDFEAEDLDEDILEALEDGEKVVVCQGCGTPLLEDDATTCETCGRTLCESCFGDTMAETECKKCLDNFS